MDLENCEFIVLQVKTLDKTCQSDKEFREKVRELIKLSELDSRKIQEDNDD